MKALDMSLPKKAPVVNGRTSLMTLKGGIGDRTLSLQQVLNINERSKAAYEERQWNKMFRLKHKK